MIISQNIAKYIAIRFDYSCKLILDSNNDAGMREDIWEIPPDGFSVSLRRMCMERCMDVWRCMKRTTVVLF